MSFQTRRKIVRRKRRSSASSMKSLSERLFDWRERNDLSQSEAALKLRVSKRTLQEWEHGRAEPRPEQLPDRRALLARRAHIRGREEWHPARVQQPQRHQPGDGR